MLPSTILILPATARAHATLSPSCSLRSAFGRSAALHEGADKKALVASLYTPVHKQWQCRLVTYGAHREARKRPIFSHSKMLSSLGIEKKIVEYSGGMRADEARESALLDGPPRCGADDFILRASSLPDYRLLTLLHDATST